MDFGVSALMKKCPSCYAIMKETTTLTQVQELQKKPTEGTPRVHGPKSASSAASAAISRKSLEAGPSVWRVRVARPDRYARAAGARVTPTMVHLSDWHVFDPCDRKTCPRDIAPVQVKFDDGRTEEGDSLTYFPKLMLLPTSSIKARRYIKATDLR